MLALPRDLPEKASPLWIVGGNVPRGDHEPLKELGVDGVFNTGTPFEEIVNFIREKVKK